MKTTFNLGGDCIINCDEGVKLLGVTTDELQWLEHLWDYKNMFETGVVRAIEGLLCSQVRRHNRDILSIFST